MLCLRKNKYHIAAALLTAVLLCPCSENFNKDWLGSFSIDEKISKSGLWNIQHVNINNEKYNNETKVEINNFLNELEILTKM